MMSETNAERAASQAAYRERRRVEAERAVLAAAVRLVGRGAQVVRVPVDSEHARWNPPDREHLNGITDAEALEALIDAVRKLPADWWETQPRSPEADTPACATPETSPDRGSTR